MQPQDPSHLGGATSGVDRDDRPPCLELTLIEFRLMFGYACTHEGTDKSGDPGPGRCVGENHAQGARREGRAYYGNHTRQNAETRKGSKAQPGQGTGERTRSGVRFVFGNFVIRHAVSVLNGDADLLPPESGGMEFSDSLVGVCAVFKHADHGGTWLSFHAVDNKQTPGRSPGRTHKIRRMSFELYKIPVEKMLMFGA